VVNNIYFYYWKKGKKRRLTFMECNNDMNSMIDIAKVADLVLLMIDASFGFEMVRMASYF
jgi:selenocysteine-specific translation elongation factor